MRTDKNEAIKLRKLGYSYNEINKVLNTPKSTLSYWLKELDIPNSLKKQILKKGNKKSSEALIKRNKQQTKIAHDRHLDIKEKAKKEFLQLKDNHLFLSAINLYWAEGYKKGAYGSKWKGFDFANSDKEMIILIINFLENICKIPREKIKLQIIAHQNVNIDKAISFWSCATKLPPNQFWKTYCTTTKNRKNRKINLLTYGTVHIRVNDVNLFFKMIGWIDGLKDYYKRGMA
ncbi:MAG: hypothetical protein K9M44_01315 [Candidatus Pacebacteria bacterium]|nr:hypothetical protein [Candidatus Paceibacterota bacterium]